jgi:hypothetical protein
MLSRPVCRYNYQLVVLVSVFIHYLAALIPVLSDLYHRPRLFYHS